ncbi:MAG: enoyl-CoA hydratase/isomerase family protein [Ilumatobacteraceae bacterium]|nr:enoyl-CoA hydratase/isomerase family protein [Ilumatobacteraceae bacterium]
MSIDLEKLDGIGIITINRPERKNAFTRSQYEDLASALRDIDTDDSVHVAIITGAGGAFSSGQDLKEMAEMATAVASGTPASSQPGGFTVLLDGLETFSKPLIAAVNGVAVGIGMTLLPFCDIVLIDETARMRVPFSELGVPPEAASSILFADQIGWQRAAEILFTARWIEATEAVEIGLALRTAPQGEVLAHAVELAKTIASKSAYSTRVIKQLMVAGRGGRIKEARAREEALFAELFRSRGFSS